VAAVLADADAAAASAPHDRAPVVKPDGKSTNRNAEPANAAAPGTTCNNPADGTDAREMSGNSALGAGPRAAARRRPQPPQLQLQPGWRCSPPVPLRAPTLADAGVRDNADFAPAAALSPACWPDSADWHTSAANAAPLVGKLHCNSDLGADKDGTAVHSLSGDSTALETTAALDWQSTGVDTEVGPREVVTPEGQASAESVYSSPRRSHLRANNSLQFKLLAAIAQ